MKTIAEVDRWIQGATAECGDPSIPVCQFFARYDLFCFRDGDDFMLWLGPELAVPLLIERGGPQLDKDGSLIAFGATQVTRGVWALLPSLNIPGVIHGFVILYDVPSPAPWERLIIFPGEVA